MSRQAVELSNVSSDVAARRRSVGGHRNGERFRRDAKERKATQSMRSKGSRSIPSDAGEFWTKWWVAKELAMRQATEGVRLARF